MVKGIYKKPIFKIAGDQGLLMEYGNIIDPGINSRIRAMAAQFKIQKPRGIVEVIPTYCSMIIIYDPEITDPDILMPALIAMDENSSRVTSSAPKTVELPVCYDHIFGLDIEYVAEFNNLSVQKVIKSHTAPLYPIYMIGFTPGFPYLGGLSEKLHTPRLASPRTLVPAGSVGIANNQTGIYPMASPGGWQLIGRCPVKLFNPQKENPILLKAGDLLKFTPISMEEYHAIKGENQ
ncbi:MAG: 5-oxoprolinase subunit PxpB [Thermodesulfobacteriota bacterium]|nr:5-oxoprolinase subunit PxpB [Thermodesulfobacteriota bacterium]